MHRRAFLTLPLAAGVPAVARQPTRPGTVALVLGGGGCRGYGHIGVLRILHREGLRPDLVVGSSSGAIVGALYAAGVSVDELAGIGERLSANLLRDWIFPRLGLFGGGAIARFVRERAGERAIESLPMGFAAIATDLRNGDRVVLDRGDVGTAVQASGSVPGLLEPVRVGKRLCVDGNLCSPVPVGAAKALGAQRVVAIDVSFPPAEANLEDPIDALYQGFSILTRRLAVEERAAADLVIEPAMPDYAKMSARVVREHIAAGEAAAERALPALRRLFAPRPRGA